MSAVSSCDRRDLFQGGSRRPALRPPPSYWIRSSPLASSLPPDRDSRRTTTNLRPRRDGGVRERSAVPPLLDPGSARIPLCRATGVVAKDRASPCNGGVSGVAYSVLRTVWDATHGPIRRHRGSGLTPSPDRSARVWRRLLAPINVDTLFACRPNVAAGRATVNQIGSRRIIRRLPQSTRVSVSY